MKGEIQRLIQKKGKSGASYWLLDIEGTLFSTADPMHVEGLKEGDTVQVQWEKVGGYNNITAIRKIENPQDTRARQLARMSCLRTAGEIAASTKLTPKKKVKFTLEAAREFEKYVNSPQ